MVIILFINPVGTGMSLEHPIQGIISRGSSVTWSRLGQNLKIQKKSLGQTFKSQVKNKFSFPCIPIFKNV